MSSTASPFAFSIPTTIAEHQAYTNAPSYPALSFPTPSSSSDFDSPGGAIFSSSNSPNPPTNSTTSVKTPVLFGGLPPELMFANATAVGMVEDNFRQRPDTAPAYPMSSSSRSFDDSNVDVNRFFGGWTPVPGTSSQFPVTASSRLQEVQQIDLLSGYEMPRYNNGSNMYGSPSVTFTDYPPDSVQPLSVLQHQQLSQSEKNLLFPAIDNTSSDFLPQPDNFNPGPIHFSNTPSPYNPHSFSPSTMVRQSPSNSAPTDYASQNYDPVDESSAAAPPHLVFDSQNPFSHPPPHPSYTYTQGHPQSRPQTHDGANFAFGHQTNGYQHHHFQQQQPARHSVQTHHHHTHHPYSGLSQHRASLPNVVRPHTASSSSSRLNTANSTLPGDVDCDDEGSAPGTGGMQKKRPRRRFDEIERLYGCLFPGCNKAYGTLNHLNAHVLMQKHGEKRTPAEFKELRKIWRRQKKEEQAALANGQGGGDGQRPMTGDSEASDFGGGAGRRQSLGEVHWNVAPFGGLTEFSPGSSSSSPPRPFTAPVNRGTAGFGAFNY